MIWIYTAIVFAITSTLGYGLHSLDVTRIEAKQAETLQAQVKSDNQQCEKDKQITKDTANDIQNKFDALNVKYNNKLQHPARCIMQITRRTSTANGASQPIGNVGSYGLSSEFLRDFAKEGNAYQIEVQDWQSFYEKVRKLNGQ